VKRSEHSFLSVTHLIYCTHNWIYPNLFMAFYRIYFYVCIIHNNTILMWGWYNMNRRMIYLSLSLLKLSNPIPLTSNDSFFRMVATRNSWILILLIRPVSSFTWERSPFRALFFSLYSWILQKMKIDSVHVSNVGSIHSICLAMTISIMRVSCIFVSKTPLTAGSVNWRASISRDQSHDFAKTRR